MCVRERGEREEIARAQKKEYVWGLVNSSQKARERERKRDMHKQATHMLV